jgi:hypothetical protein
MAKKWYKKAIMKKPPYNLGGWSKSQSATTRRRNALSSRPKSWSLKRKRLSAGRGLIALSNVTKDKPTKMKAKQDANYFFRMLK